MTDHTPGPKKAHSPTSTRRRRRRVPSETEKLRRERAAQNVRAVTVAKLNGNPVVPAEPPARMYMRKDLLEPQEVQAMLDACSSTSRIGMRDRALLAAGYYGCLRGDELANLAVDHVDLTCGILAITNGRTKRLRYVAYSPEHFAPIAAWAERREGLYKVRERVGFFCSLNEKEGRGHLSGGHEGPGDTVPEITVILRRLATAAKVKKPVDPMALRRARARELALAGATLTEMCGLLDVASPDYARQLVTEVAPHAPCTGHYDVAGKAEKNARMSAAKKGKRPPNYGKKYPAQVLTPKEVQAMMRKCNPRTSQGLRNRALIVVLWRCGLRIAEALDLEPRDIDLVDGVVTVRSGKGGYRRLVGIDEQAGQELKKWLTWRGEKLGLPEEGYVFCTIALPGRGRRMTPSTFSEGLKLLAKKAGITKRVHPHGLRHTHAYELMKEGIPLTIIQKQLGHKDLAMTAKYMDHLHPREVINAVSRRQWGDTPEDDVR